MSPIAPNDPDFVTALARGLDVITCFGQGAEALTLSEVAKETGLTRGTARRLLLTLEALGYLRSDGKTFRLAPKTLDARLCLSVLAAALAGGATHHEGRGGGAGRVVLAWRAGRARRGLRRPRDAEASVLYAHPSRHADACPHQRHGPGPACRARSDELDEYFSKATFEKITKYTLTDEAEIRKVLMRVARDRYALSDRQLQIGIRSIAVPIPAKSGRSEVAINATANESRASKRDLIDRFLPVLRRASDQLSHAL